MHELSIIRYTMFIDIYLFNEVKSLINIYCIKFRASAKSLIDVLLAA